MKKSFSKTIAVLLAVLMVVCSLPMTVFAAGESRSNVQLQFGTYFASGAGTHQTYVDESYSGFDESGLNTAKLDYDKATGTITEASSGHTYGVGDFFTVSVLLENTSSLAATQVGIKYSDNIVPAAVGENEDGLTALIPATDVTSPTEGYAPNEAITSQSGNAIYNTASSTVGEISYIDANAKTMWANFAVQDGTDAVDLTAPKTVGVNTFTKTAVLATFGFKIVGTGAVTFSLADSKDIDSAYYVETIANGGKVEEYKTYTQTNYDGSTALDFMGDNENIESTKYTVKFVGADGTVISEAQYAEGATVTVPDLPKAEKISDTQHNTYAWDTEPALTATADATYTAVATAEDHKWDTGVKQDDGSTLYTCTVCGSTKSETAHVHSWGEWTYNGDAEFKVKDGTATRSCTTCKETETKTIEGTSLFAHRIANTEFASKTRFLSATLPATMSKFKNVYVKFTREDGKEFFVKSDEIVTDNYGYKYYPFEITPQSLASDIKVQYFGETEDGITVWGDVVTYNLMTKYIQKQLSSTTNENWKKLLVELVYYGYENQIKAGWKLDDPLTGYLTDEQKQLHDSSIPTDLKEYNNKSYQTIDNPITAWRGNNCTFGASTEIMFYANKVDLTDDLSAHVRIQGESKEYVYSYSNEKDKQYFKQSGSYTIFTFPDTPTKRLRSELYVTLYKGDTPVSNTFLYSAETYCAKQLAKDPTASQQLTKITNQLMHFANAARAYFGVN